MTEPDPTPADPPPATETTKTETTNNAQRGATVGFQASVVHQPTVNINTAAASPEELYEAGIRFLDIGLPARARELIAEAIARRYDTTKARFHLVLALLSKRSERDLTRDEQEQLDRMSVPAPADQDDRWTRPLSLVAALLAKADDPDTDRGHLLKRLHALPDDQRNAIIRHLDLVLADVLTDNAWSTIHKAARGDQFSGNRVGRAWAYFHADPAPVLSPAPADDSPTVGAWFRAAVTVVIFAAAAGRVAATALHGGQLVPTLALLVGIVACCVAWRAGREWDFRAVQLAAHERDHAFGRSLRPPAAGFTTRVGHRFEYYVNKYAPRGANVARLLDETAGIRSTLRDEVAGLYGRSHTIEQVNWLIRYLVSDLVKRWKEERLYDYRARYRTTPLLKAFVVASTGTAVTAAFVVTAHAAEIDPVGSTSAAAIAAVAGVAAAACTAQVANDRRRHIDDERQRADAFAARNRAREKWRNRLNDTRPSETEMERWLDADRTVFLGTALATYRLKYRDLIASTTLQSRTRRYTRARAADGPWRYSHNVLSMFLMTHDGVREVRTEIDFAKGEVGLVERTNYRFDAISSVQVTRHRDARIDLALTLTNGDPREFRIADSDPETAGSGKEPAARRSDADIDSTGFAHALHVLEGMAAEGRRWIDLHPPAPRSTGVSDRSLHDTEDSVAEPPDAA